MEGLWGAGLGDGVGCPVHHRREMGLPDVAVYDTDLAVKTAVAGVGELIKADKEKN